MCAEFNAIFHVHNKQMNMYLMHLNQYLHIIQLNVPHWFSLMKIRIICNLILNKWIICGFHVCDWDIFSVNSFTFLIDCLCLSASKWYFNAFACLSLDEIVAPGSGLNSNHKHNAIAPNCNLLLMKDLFHIPLLFF